MCVISNYFDWFELDNKLFAQNDPFLFCWVPKSLVLNQWQCTNLLEEKKTPIIFFFILCNYSVDVIYTEAVLIMSQKTPKQ